MRPLSYVRATTVDDAVAAVSGSPDSAFLAGGTTEIDLLRLGVVRPWLLVDVNDLPLADVEDVDGGVRIGATARMSDVARDPRIVERYPGMSQALLSGASEQLRNMASMGGNLCQRTRCAYFRDGESPCNKRAPGTGCSALHGMNRGHAILGVSEHCIATHPSDVAVALVALDAVVRTIGPDGVRSIPAGDFFLPPGDTPDVEHPLAHGELIVAIDVPDLPVARTSRYVKHRDRASYEFALVSVFCALRVDGGRVAEARVALGGVGTVPWRGWPVRRVERRWLRLLAANAVVLLGGWATYTLLRLAAGPQTVTAAAGTVIAAALVVSMLFENAVRPHLSAPVDRVLSVAVVAALAAVLYLTLAAVAGAVDLGAAEPAEWVTHASLNALGFSVILHVAVGRRWPFQPAGRAG